MIRHLIYLILGIFCCMPTLALWAQSTTSAQVAMGPVKADVWTMLSSRVRNPTAKPLDYLLTTQLLNCGQPIQYAKRGWLPPQSATREWIPLRMGNFSTNVQSIETETLLLDTSTSPDRQIGNRETGLLPVQHSEVLFALWGDSEIDPGMAVAAALKSQGIRPAVQYLRRESFPSLPELWQGINCVVLAQNQNRLELAQIAALRSYLIGGGRIWIMAERLDPEFMALLLQQDWTGQVIDEIELADFTVNRNRAQEVRRFDPPVKMVRMIAPEMETLLSVKGWPIALRKRVGHGQLFITTLEYAGWLRNKHEPSEALADLAGLLVAPSEPPLLPAANLRQLAAAAALERTPSTASATGARAPSLPPSLPASPTRTTAELSAVQAINTYLVNQIGYKIVARTPVMIVLLGFCVLLLVGGFYLNAKRRLEYIFPMGLVFAGLATAALLGMGLTQRQAKPLTFASLQTGQMAEGQNTLTVSGLMQVYSPGSADAPLAVTRGGLAWPDMAGSEGRLLRMVWTDRDRFQWDNLPLPSGAMLPAEVKNSVMLVHPPTVRGVFGPEGLTATLDPGPFSDLNENLILMTPMARLAPRTSGNALLFGDEDILPAGQYIAGSVITAASSYRQEVYRQLLEGKRVAEPMLVGWTRQYDSGIQLASGTRGERKESLILALPVTLENSPAGSKISVPSAFIPYTVPRNVGSVINSPIYDTRNGTWISVSGAVKVFLRFQLPPQVLPLQVEGQRLTVDIIAPGRTVEIFTRDAKGAEQLVQTATSPMGRINVSLSDKQLAPVDSKGGMLIGLNVGSHDNLENMWELQSIHLSVKGQKLPAR